MQLLQYEPTTKKVHKRPLLIIPPWINKYYILDLREKNSLIKWAVDQGMHGVRDLVGQSRRAARAQELRRLHASRARWRRSTRSRRRPARRRSTSLGYCLGGTLLAATLAYMAAKKDKRIVSATFMTSLVDFTRTGELEVFIDEEPGRLAREEDERARLSSTAARWRRRSTCCARNDLIWSFVINNYLMGRDPFPFDLLHWNRDSTRMPATMHSFYLRNMYMKNLLREPGGITLDGVPIDLSKVDDARPTSCRRSRTTSRRGRRRTPGRSSSAASRASCCRAPGTSPA